MGFSGSITKRFRILEDQEINVKTLGAMGDGISNDGPILQKALDLAFSRGGGTVLVPDGYYLIGSQLLIKRNVQLILHQNARMLRGFVRGSFLANYPSNADTLTDPTDSYSGHGNITIEGGTWDGNVLSGPDSTSYNMFAFTRGRDITFRNITFKDVKSNHSLDLASLENVLIDNCNFLGYKDATTDQSRDYAEAIQIAPFTKLGSGGTGDFSGKSVKNITIQNCYFGSSGTAGMGPVATGIGNHSSVHDEYVEDVKIINNTFEGMTYAGIRNFKFKNCKVSGNTFIGCKNDILCSADDGFQTWVYDPATKDMVHADKEPQSGSYMNVTENHFVGTISSTFVLRGWAGTNGIGYWDNIRFTNNTFDRGAAPDVQPDSIKSTGNAIQMTWAKNVVVRDNQLSDVQRGVVLYNCLNATVENNRIESTQYEGIYVSELDDTFKNLGYTGYVNIRNNTLANIPYTGIYMSYSKGGSIRGNRLNNIAYQSDNTRDAIGLVYSDSIEMDDNYIDSKLNNRPRYGIGINNNCNNCRVGSNYISWVATAPVYANASNWRGDYTINKTNVLWSGNNLMGEVSPGTVAEVVPTKKLSDCRNGWILVWSDYDFGASYNDYDFNYTVIPKYAAEAYNGKLHAFSVSSYLNTNGAALTIKLINVYNEKLTGIATNNMMSNGTVDVTLRQVIEW
jgi:parallel beta-helix repeat protein